MQQQDRQQRRGRRGGENVAQNARIGTQEPSSTRYGNVVKLRGDLGRDSGPAEASTTRGDLAMQPEFSRRFIACAHCGSEFFARDRTRIYCRVKCTRDARKLESRDPYIGSATRGAISELRACVDLMSKGYHVYRAMSSSCPADLVAWGGDGRPVRVEVKTAVRNEKTGKLYRPSAARNQFDVICYVTRDEVIYEPPIEEW
jgi:hypothetical protein